MDTKENLIAAIREIAEEQTKTIAGIPPSVLSEIEEMEASGETKSAKITIRVESLTIRKNKGVGLWSGPISCESWRKGTEQ